MLAEVKKCVERQDIKGLRYIFVDCLDVDPTFEKYEADYKYCESIPGMFDRHIELTGFISDKRRWTKEYWGQLKTDLMKNFSKERFGHMVDVAKVVYADKIDRLLNERNSTRQHEDKASRHPARQASVSDVPNPEDGAPKRISQRRLQEEKIEKEKRELEAHNQKVEKERTAQEENNRAEPERSVADRHMKTTGKNDKNGVYGSKKFMGIVLAAIIVAVVLIIKALQ